MVRRAGFEFNGLSWDYAEWGQGSSVLLCLHGFGRSPEDFVEFTASLPDRYRMVAPSLFFHGASSVGSRLSAEEPLRTAEWEAFLRAFIAHLGVEQVSLLGYSLGGRLAISALQLIPEKIERAWLFAPDGLLANKWYKFLTQSRFGRSVFRWFIRHDAWYFKLLGGARRIGLVSAKLHDFIRSQIATREQQWQIYHTWTFLRLMKLDRPRLRKVLRAHALPIDLYVGRHDRVIKPHFSRRLSALSHQVTAHTLETGHGMLTKDVGETVFKRVEQVVDNRQSD